MDRSEHIPVCFWPYATDRGMTSMRLPTSYRWAAVLLTAAMTAGMTSASAAGKPDLVATGTKAASAQGVAGKRLEVTTKVKNAGSGPASATKTAFYLSKDTRQNKGDVLLGRARTASIAPGATKSVALSAAIPRATKAAAYRVLACADAAKQVRESNENNNCKASSGSVDVSAAYDSTPFGPAAPVTVYPLVDSQDAVTKSISAANGGQVTATRNGDSFTLDIPAGALETDTEVTMTPLASLEDHPFDGGFAAGVQLGPQGLTFLKPATLTIVPATPVPVAREATFAANDFGDQFHLYPVEITPPNPTFKILHFSIYGVGDSTDDEPPGNPSDTMAALEQQMHDIFKDARRRYFQEGDDGLSEAELNKIVDIGEHYYDVVVKPLLIEAGNIKGCTGLEEKREALKIALLWARQMELLGVDGSLESRIDEMYDLIAKLEAPDCKFPRTWTGQVGGTLETSNGLIETFTGTMTYTLIDEGYVAIYDGEGTLQWEVSGTDKQSGCTWQSSASLKANGDGGMGDDPEFPPPWYEFRWARSTIYADATKSCPQGGSQDALYMPLNITAPRTDTQPMTAGQTTVSGTRTYPVPDDPASTLTISWKFTASN